MKTSVGWNLYTFNITTVACLSSNREGSIITEYIVQTTQVIPDEIAEANEKVPEAMRPIAPVLGSVTAFYNSKF